MNTMIMLQIAGALGVFIGLYHGVVGDKIMRSMTMSPAEHTDLMRGAFHIGTVGWVVGGCLLFVAATAPVGSLRTAVIVLFALVYGLPGFGNLVINKGRPNIGWVTLLVIAALSLFALWM